MWKIGVILIVGGCTLATDFERFHEAQSLEASTQNGEDAGQEGSEDAGQEPPMEDAGPERSEDAGKPSLYGRWRVSRMADRIPCGYPFIRFARGDYEETWEIGPSGILVSDTDWPLTIYKEVGPSQYAASGAGVVDGVMVSMVATHFDLTWDGGDLITGAELSMVSDCKHLRVVEGVRE